MGTGNRILSAAFAAFAASALTATAQAEQPRPGWSEPYGWSNRQAAEPYRPESRDAAGNRILYNGRPVTLPNGQAGPSSRAASFNSGVSSLGPSTLSRTTLTAAAIGNSVDIRNVRNSTIIINQHNTGRQSATVNRGG